VRTLYANNGSLAAQVNLRQAEIAKAQAEVQRANDDLNRRQSLVGNGAVSKEELNHAQTQLTNARKVNLMPSPPRLLTKDGPTRSPTPYMNR